MLSIGRERHVAVAIKAAIFIKVSIMMGTISNIVPFDFRYRMNLVNLAQNAQFLRLDYKNVLLKSLNNLSMGKYH